MTAKVVKDRAASVRERLLNLARRRGEDFQITLRNYLFERFLYRLSLSDVKERFVVVSFDENSIVVEPIRADEEYAGVRATFEARLGAIRERLQVDVGFGDILWPPAPELTYPVTLGEAAPILHAYRPETVIAEKLEAIVSLGIRNSRIKDFFDIDYLARTERFERPVLIEAIRRTFARRLRRYSRIECYPKLGVLEIDARVRMTGDG